MVIVTNVVAETDVILLSRLRMWAAVEAIRIREVENREIQLRGSAPVNLVDGMGG